MSPAHAVERCDGFRSLAAAGLRVVVDPLVFRAGELFLRGRKGARHPLNGSALDEQAAWDFLDRNLEAVGFFFDVLVLHERLPLFDYSDTLDAGANFDDRSLGLINAAAQDAVLVPVNVRYGTYAALKNRAVERLGERLAQVGRDTRAWAEAGLAPAITRQLAPGGWRWEPRSDIESELATDADRKLLRFLLGGMIFGQYADLMDAEHWLPPKRARLFVQATIDGAPAQVEDEGNLFDRLGRQCRLQLAHRWQPTFLHRILAEAHRREDIPAIVARLRASGAVRDYRAWRARALDAWRRGGVTQETEALAHDLRAALAGDRADQGDVHDASVAWVDTAVAGVEAEAAAVVPASAAALPGTAPSAWSVVQGLWPGRRHLKLLAACARARQRQPHIERAIATLWRD